ncbi:hypothetical protein D9M69_547550 [compost metagenome]
MARLAQQLGGLAPELALHAGLPREVLQVRVVGHLALGLLQARQPGGVELGKSGFQCQHQLSLLPGIQGFESLPHRLQPGPGQIRGLHAVGLADQRIGHQLVGALRSRQRQLGHDVLAGVQPVPDPLQLRQVVGLVQGIEYQTSHDAARSLGRKRAVLGQQARGFQRFGGGPTKPSDAQLQAQRLGAACRALWQLGQAAARCIMIAVFHRPAHGTQQRAFDGFGCAADQSGVQCGLQVGIATFAVLQ